MTDIIEKKRDKKPLDDKEIAFFVSGVTDKSIPDYQISALLMAILLNGCLLYTSRGNKQIHTIAYENGFNSVSYFYEVFKAYTGLNPAEFKAKNY